MKRVGNKEKTPKSQVMKEKKLVSTTRLMPSLSLSSSPPAKLPSSFTAEHDAPGAGVSLGSVGISCPLAVLSPRLLCTPNLLTGGMGRVKSLALRTPCSAITETLLYHQHCFQQDPKLICTSAAMKKIKSILAKTTTHSWCSLQVRNHSCKLQVKSL